MEFELEAALDDRVILDLELGSVEILERMDVALIASLAPPGEDPRVVFINDAALRLLGYPRNEVLGRSPSFWSGEEISTTDSGSAGATLNVTYVHRDGGQKPARLRVSTHAGAWGSWTISALLPLEENRSGAAPGPNEPEEPMSVGDLTLDPASRWTQYRRERIQLTPAECVLLRTLMRKAGAVVERSEVHQELWGYEPPRRTRAVDVYAASLRRKLRDLGAPDMIQTIRGVGYQLKP